MENIKRFFIDANVAALLFNTEDEARIEKIVSDLQAQYLAVSDDTLTEFLESKGQPQEEIEKIKEIDNFDNLPEEIKGLLTDQEYGVLLQSNLEALSKSYFEKLYPQLTSEKQTELVEYMAKANELVELVNSQNTELEGLQKELQEEHGVGSVQELAKQWNQEEIIAKNSSGNIPVNLGGVNTAAPVAPEPVIVSAPVINETSNTPAAATEVQAPVAEVTPAVVEPQIVPVTPDLVAVTPEVVTPEQVAVAEPMTPPATNPQAKTESTTEPFDWTSLIMNGIQKTEVNDAASAAPVETIPTPAVEAVPTPVQAGTFPVAEAPVISETPAPNEAPVRPENPPVENKG